MVVELSVVAGIAVATGFIGYMLGFWHALWSAQQDIDEAEAECAAWKLKYDKMHGEYLNSQIYQGHQMG